MRKEWLKRQGERDLVLYMLGWASTPNAVCHIHPPGCDVLAVHRYMSLEPFAADEFAAYRRIYLFAWSFGVWAAEQCCRELPLYRAVALNGTPFPADARYGMRLRAALRRIRSVARLGVNPFELAEPGRGEPAGPYPEPSVEDRVEELTRLAEWSEAGSAAHLHWDKAWIADKDEMFPPANMWAWWGSVGRGFEGYHYPFADPARVLCELACEPVEG